MTREQALQRCEELLAGWAGHTPGPWSSDLDIFEESSDGTMGIEACVKDADISFLITRETGERRDKSKPEDFGPDFKRAEKTRARIDMRLISCSPSLPVLVGWIRDRLMEHAETSYHHRAGRRGTERSCLCGAILPCSAEASLCSLVEKL